MITVTTVDSFNGTWTDPTGNGKGKFYGAIIVHAEDPAANIDYYVPVWNWGAGRYRGHASGQFGVGRFMHSQRQAVDEATKQMQVKANKGYAVDGHAYPPPNSGRPAPAKVAKFVSDNITASSAFNPAPGRATRPAFTNPNGEKVGTALIAFVDAFEVKATTVLTTGDVDKAAVILAQLKGEFAKFTEQFERAEAALEMAHLQVRSRLSK